VGKKTRPKVAPAARPEAKQYHVFIGKGLIDKESEDCVEDSCGKGKRAKPLQGYNSCIVEALQG